MLCSYSPISNNKENVALSKKKKVTWELGKIGKLV